MSRWVVILGSLMQLILAPYLFIFAVMGAGAGKNEIIGIGMWALPLSCIISAALVIYFYKTNSSKASYFWYILPIFLTILFVYLAINVK